MRYQLIAIAAAVTTACAAVPQPESYAAAPPSYQPAPAPAPKAEEKPAPASVEHDTVQRNPDDQGDGSYWQYDQSDYTNPPKYCPEDDEKPPHYGPAEPYPSPDDEGYKHNDNVDKPSSPPAPCPGKEVCAKPPMDQPQPEHQGGEDAGEDDYTQPPRYCPDDSEKPEHYGLAEPYKCPDDQDYVPTDEHVDVPVNPAPKPDTPASPEQSKQPENAPAPAPPAATTYPVPVATGNSTQPHRPVAYTGGAPTTGALSGVGALVAGLAAVFL